MAALAWAHSSWGSNMRTAQLGGVVLPLLSHVSRLFTPSSFEATPAQDVIWDVDFNLAHLGLFALLQLQSLEVAVGLRKLITKNDMVECYIREGQLCATGNGFVFGGANGEACVTSLCQIAMSPSTWIHIKPPWKLLGVQSALIAPAAQMHFPIPCVPLLANTLIITSLENVHSQELLVMDSTQFSISYLVMAEKGNIFGFMD